MTEGSCVKAGPDIGREVVDVSGLDRHVTQLRPSSGSPSPR